MDRADQADHADRAGDASPGDAERSGAALALERDDVHHDASGTTVPRVRAAGELDAATSSRLLDAIGEAVDGAVGATDPARGEAVVVVELDGVTFCDSRGLSALIMATRSAARAGASLRLVAAQDAAVARLLARTGMTGLLPLQPDTASALAAGTPSPLEREVGPA